MDGGSRMILDKYLIKVCTTCETSLITWGRESNLCHSCELESHLIPYMNIQNPDQIMDIIYLALNEADFPVPEVVYDIYENFKTSNQDENAARLIGRMFEGYM